MREAQTQHCGSDENGEDMDEVPKCDEASIWENGNFRVFAGCHERFALRRGSSLEAEGTLSTE